MAGELRFDLHQPVTVKVSAFFIAPPDDLTAPAIEVGVMRGGAANFDRNGPAGVDNYVDRGCAADRAGTVVGRQTLS